MNMIDVQDKLKGLSQQQLVAEMQSPSGVAPQFLVLSEITRRKRMQDSYQNQQQQPNTTIAEEAVASAGVPGGGLAAMARSMAPNSSMAQNTAAMPQPVPQEQPVQGMYGGGYVQKMAVGGQPADMSNPMVSAWVQREAQRRGVTVEEVLANLGPTGAAISAAAPSMAARNQMLGLEPVGTSNFNFPTQADLDSRALEDKFGINSRPMVPQPIDTLPDIYPPAPREGRVIGREPPAFPSPAAPQMPEPVDLDLTAPMASTPVAPRPQDMRLMGLEPQGSSSPRVNDILDQMEYGFTPGSDRRLTAAEILSQSAGPMPELPAAPKSATPEAPAPETTLSIDPYTGRFMNAPTIGKQMSNLGENLSGAADYIAESLPALDMSSGNPYSELTDEEMSALTSGRLSPETADAIQSSRLAMAQYSRGAGGEASTPAAAKPEGDTTAAPPSVSTRDGTVTTTTPAVTSESSPTTNSGASVTGRGSGAAVGGANAPTSYEQELRDAMARAEKRANQDKWLALAQVGMQLMASKEPTLGGALGEAGIAGLQAFRGSRDAYENERLGLTKSLYDLQQQQAAAIAAQRAAATKATGGSYGIKDIMGIADQYDKAIKSMMVDNGLGGLVMPTDEESVARIAELKREKDKYIGMLIPQSTFDATAQ